MSVEAAAGVLTAAAGLPELAVGVERMIAVVTAVAEAALIAVHCLKFAAVNRYWELVE